MFELNPQECTTVVCALRTQFESLNSDLVSPTISDVDRRTLEITLAQVSALLDKFERSGVRVVSRAHGGKFV